MPNTLRGIARLFWHFSTKVRVSFDVLFAAQGEGNLRRIAKSIECSSASACARHDIAKLGRQAGVDEFHWTNEEGRQDEGM